MGAVWPWLVISCWHRPAETLREVEGVIILGTGGGSAASGNLLRSYLSDRARVPILVSQGYDLPAWVGPRTLAIGVTYSGNTEETLSAFSVARRRSARLLALTAGGKLRQEITAAGFAAQP